MTSYTTKYNSAIIGGLAEVINYLQSQIFFQPIDRLYNILPE